MKDGRHALAEMGQKEVCHDEASRRVLPCIDSIA